MEDTSDRARWEEVGTALEKLDNTSHHSLENELQHLSAFIQAPLLLDPVGSASITDVLLKRLWVEPHPYNAGAIAAALTSIAQNLSAGHIPETCQNGIASDKQTVSAREASAAAKKQGAILIELLSFLLSGRETTTPDEVDATPTFENMQAAIVPRAPLVGSLLNQILQCLKVILQSGTPETPSAVYPIAKFLSHRDHNVRKLSIELLATAGLNHQNVRIVGAEGREPSSEVQDSHNVKDWALVHNEDTSPCASAQYLKSNLRLFVEDPVPVVRLAALKAITDLHSGGAHLDHEDLRVAAKALEDKYEDVRLAAVQVVGKWCQASTQEGQNVNGTPDKLLDWAYQQVASKATDMSMRVRRAAFEKLAVMPSPGVSVQVLLQSLAKKLAPHADPQQTGQSQLPSKETSELVATQKEGVEEDTGLVANWAAGAFVHGLEDEFWEVRMAALHALATLSWQCPSLLEPAAPLLVDAVNDDNEEVRLAGMASLEALAEGGAFMLALEQLEMVVGCLEDANWHMRAAAVKVLSKLRYPSLAALQSVVDSLLEHHWRLRQKEDERVLEAMATLGSRNPSLVELGLPRFLDQAKTLEKAEGGISQVAFAALLVLVFSAALSGEKLLGFLPPAMWRYLCFLEHKLPPVVRSLVPARTPRGRDWPGPEWTSRKRLRLDGTMGSVSLGRGSGLGAAPKVDIRSELQRENLGWENSGLFPPRTAPGVGEGVGKGGLRQEEARGASEAAALRLGLGEGVRPEAVTMLESLLRTAHEAQKVPRDGPIAETLQTLRGCCKDLKRLANADKAEAACRFWVVQVKAIACLVKCKAATWQLVETISQVSEKLHLKGQESRNGEKIGNSKRSHSQQNMPQQEAERILFEEKDKLEQLMCRMDKTFHGVSGDHKLQLLEVTLLVLALKALLASVQLTNEPSTTARSPNGTSQAHPRERLHQLWHEVRTAGVLIRTFCDKEGVQQSKLVQDLACINLVGPLDADITPLPADVIITLADIIQKYHIKQLPFSQTLVEVWATILLPKCTPDQPLPFFASLPLGIAVEALVYNIDHSCKVCAKFEVTSTKCETMYRYLEWRPNPMHFRLGSAPSARSKGELEPVSNGPTFDTNEAKCYSSAVNLYRLPLSDTFMTVAVSLAVEVDAPLKLGVGATERTMIDLCRPQMLYFVASKPVVSKRP